jgi:hypothetical protein
MISSVGVMSTSSILFTIPEILNHCFARQFQDISVVMVNIFMKHDCKWSFSHHIYQLDRPQWFTGTDDFLNLHF